MRYYVRGRGSVLRGTLTVEYPHFFGANEINLISPNES